jgi:hypothetical protein
VRSPHLDACLQQLLVARQLLICPGHNKLLLLQVLWLPQLLTARRLLLAAGCYTLLLLLQVLLWLQNMALGVL